jgi:hypothetical protein
MTLSEDGNLELALHDAYVLIRAHRFIDTGSGLALLQQAANMAIRSGRRGLLIDLLPVSSQTASTALRYEFGEQLAALPRLRSGSLRVALVGKSPLFSQEGMAMLTARNRGADVSMFAELEPAIEWLSDD